MAAAAAGPVWRGQGRRARGRPEARLAWPVLRGREAPAAAIAARPGAGGP